MRHEIFWAKSTQEHCYSSVDEFHVLIIVMPCYDIISITFDSQTETESSQTEPST